MATLILTCSTGQGHNSCARAIQEYYLAQGEECRVADALSFVSRGVSQLICKGHVTMYRHFHSLFRVGYSYSERHSDGMFSDGSAVYRLLSLGAPNIRKFLEGSPYDQVICTHVFASLMITEMQKENPLPITTGLVATDYTCNPGTRESIVDWYFAPDSPLSITYECPNVSEEQIVCSGIPIRQSFYRSTEKAKAKAQCHIPAGHRHLLMMCGSMGCGPMEKLTGRLMAELPGNVDLTVICGTNEALKKSLEKKYGNRTNLHLLGYTDKMSLLMDSADLYLTKPGGISVTEAFHKNLPMVFIDAVAGCEAYNKIYFIKKGAAKTGVGIRELVDICTDILSKPRKLEKMRRNLEASPKYNASQIIFEQMHKKPVLSQD